MDDHDAVTPPPAFARSGARGEWVACRYADVQAILGDERFEVPPASDAGRVGTISWLRASVSRFVNGPEHRSRRADAVAELRTLRPDELRTSAHRRASDALAQAAKPGDRLDVMALLSRRVPMTVMASALGIARAQDAADAVIRIAAGYFPGSDPAAERLADTATAQLVVLLGLDDGGPGPAVGHLSGQAGTAGRPSGQASTVGCPSGQASNSPANLDVIVARIALMVQGCDATAGLIGNALHFLQDTGDAAAGWPTAAVLDEVLRYRPVLRASRRVAAKPASVNGSQVLAGDRLICNIEVANADPAATGAVTLPSLTFGYGVRPCPGQPQALALATGVIEAVRDACAFLPGHDVECEPAQPLRIPQRLEVVLR
jgi:cytochrome P450